MDLSNYVKYGEIGLVLASLVVLIYIFKTFMDFIREVLERVIVSVDSSVKANTEMQNYWKMQNGSFKDLMKETRDTLSSCPTNVKIRRRDG